MAESLVFNQRSDQRLVAADCLTGRLTHIEYTASSEVFQRNISSFSHIGNWNRTATVLTHTDKLEIPHNSSLFVRPRKDPQQLLSVPGIDERVDTPIAGALVETVTPVRLFIYLPGPAVIRRTDSGVKIGLKNTSEVRIQAVARRNRPPSVVRITDNPDALLHGINRLSAGLCTTRCERSRPDFRDTPPRFVRDSVLDIDGPTGPETGIRLLTRPSHEFLLPVAPLAYYLGASVEFASTPKLVTDDGYEYPLPNHIQPYEVAVERLLKRVLVCDSIVRTAGPYPGAQKELNHIEEQLPFNPISLYGASTSEQLTQYLKIDYQTLEPVIPEWDLKIHLPSQPESVNLLSQLAEQLVLINVSRRAAEVPTDGLAHLSRTSSLDEPESTQPRTELSTHFTAPNRPPTAADLQVELISQSDSRVDHNSVADETAKSPRTFELPETETVDTAWKGPGVPINGSKGVHHRDGRLSSGIESEPQPDSVRPSVDICIVCHLQNDRFRRDADGIVRAMRTANRGTPLSVTCEYDASQQRLSELFGQDFDLIQYIGHISEDGFEATDGYLSVASIGEVNIRSFILNGCTSVHHGEKLVDRGATAGIATIQDIVGIGAERIGVQFARLLAHGYSFRGARYLLRQVSPYIRAYTLLGNTEYRINQRDTLPSAIDIEVREDSYRVDLITLPTAATGARVDAALGPSSQDMLAGQQSKPRQLGDAALETLLAAVPNRPVFVEGEFYWAADLTPDEGILKPN